MNYTKLKKEYRQYVESYILEENNKVYKDLLRIYNKALRVMNLCEIIAKSLNLTDDDINIIKIIGLFHDIGRFEQWKKHNIFIDYKGEDHAELGVKELKKNNIIKKYVSEKDEKQIYKIIKLHNKYSIPNNLSKRERILLNILRDADKIDSIYTIVSKEKVIFIGEDAFSKIIYNDLMNKKPILLIDRKTKADFLATSLGFIFDINYIESIRILKKHNYYNQEIDLYLENTNNEELRKQLESIRNIINNEIEDRLLKYNMEVFKKYTDPYRKYGDMIIFKINHTYRVTSLCNKVSKSLGLKEDEIELINNSALLHDIARFEQWRIFKSFHGSKTVDHGNFGVEILKKNNFINQFIIDNQNDVLKIIKYHNKYKIPKTLSENTRLYIDILRDADKIDVLYALVIGELYYEDDNNNISDSIMSQAKQRVLISSKNAQSNFDWIAIDLGFIFDLKFKESFRIMKEKDYHNMIIDMYKNKTSNKKTINQLEELRVLINNFIEEKLTQ